MFAKLLKHEFNRSKKLLGLLSLGLLGLGVMDTVVLRLLVNYGDRLSESNDPAATLAMISMFSLLGLSVVALGVYVVAVIVILLVGFYKHKFTDEGYLTFTLPVKTEAIYWSSLCNIAIWQVISGVCVGLVVALVALVGSGKGSQLINGDIFSYLFEELGYLFEELQFEGLYLVQMALSAIINWVFQLMMPLACITIGAVIAKKHKILAAFGAYYIINLVTGTLESTVSIFPAIFISAAYPEAGEAAMQTMSLLSLLVTASLCVGGYFLTIHLMKRKLNLP